VRGSNDLQIQDRQAVTHRSRNGVTSSVSTTAKATKEKPGPRRAPQAPDDEPAYAQRATRQPRHLEPGQVSPPRRLTTEFRPARCLQRSVSASRPASQVAVGLNPSRRANHPGTCHPQALARYRRSLHPTPPPQSPEDQPAERNSTAPSAGSSFHPLPPAAPIPHVTSPQCGAQPQDLTGKTPASLADSQPAPFASRCH
jgi:hypothetical protein